VAAVYMSMCVYAYTCTCVYVCELTLCTQGTFTYVYFCICVYVAVGQFYMFVGLIYVFKVFHFLMARFMRCIEAAARCQTSLCLRSTCVYVYMHIPVYVYMCICVYVNMCIC